MYEFIRIETEIEKLKEEAKKHGLIIRFRDRKTNQGDFCIFIYDKSIRNSYIVGYDGCYDAKYGCCSFDSCLKSAYNWLKNRDHRFIKENGKWVMKSEYV